MYIYLGDTPPPGGDTPPPGGDTPPPPGGPPPPKDPKDFDDKVKYEYKTIIKVINKNKVVVRDYDNNERGSCNQR
jgi:hypothetical protein